MLSVSVEPSLGGQPNNVPARQCVGCRGGGTKYELVRMVLDASGEAAIDLTGGADGRGAWVHPVVACLEKAVRGGLSRSFRRQVRVDVASLNGEIRSAASRQTSRLLSRAAGSQKILMGEAAVQRSVEDDSARLVLVASDYPAALGWPWLRAIVASGRALVWGSRGTLGRMLGCADTTIVSILDARMTKALVRAVKMTYLPELNAEPLTDAKTES